ncbi:hypothetical protein H257_14756 [Aphanomyces astaci]|uniref:Peptidase A2 domain-containing protein n=1 Tax=Aphanomyces astaci TaxID=112090 RepID=W4FQ64_APHAT|nr:hypothetical protein H257_14756 [Aphanomyces astaci]ETV69617.1 hypothetical protein H257_14756 [Aphanomyces astaci]|eukprot:XP_009840944.1 hypothetical protein H257_14756 [Aphanomyces astaci]
MQTDRIRERRKNPAQDEILKTLNLLSSDVHLLLAPADIEDEAKWYGWFADTLNTCGEAKRANRDFKTTEAVAHIQRVDPNPYAVLWAGDEFVNSPCPKLYGGTRNYKRRSSKLDPTHCDDLFNDCLPSSRLVAGIAVSDTRTQTATNPFVKAYIDRVQATGLIDTGATSSFISASFWHRLGQPPLKQPRLGFVTADNSNLDISGRADGLSRLPVCPIETRSIRRLVAQTDPDLTTGKESSRTRSPSSQPPHSRVYQNQPRTTPSSLTCTTDGLDLRPG